MHTHDENGVGELQDVNRSANRKADDLPQVDLKVEHRLRQNVYQHAGHGLRSRSHN